MNSPRFAALALGALAIAMALPVSAGAAARILPGQAGLEDLDVRAGRVAPTAAQKQLVAGLGARAQWNRYGTPASLIADSGFLTTGAASGSPASIARDFVRRIGNCSSPATAGRRTAHCPRAGSRCSPAPRMRSPEWRRGRSRRT